MIRGTTPDFTLTLPVDLTDCTVYVTVRDRRTAITKSGEELSVTAGTGSSVILMWLTQEDTLKLKEGGAEIQVRYINEAGVAKATECKPVDVKKVLYEKVIEYVSDD